MTVNDSQEKQDNHRRIPPDILEFIEHTSPAPTCGPYTSLLRCNGEISPRTGPHAADSDSGAS